MKYTENDAMNLEEFKEINAKEQDRLRQNALYNKKQGEVITEYVIWVLVVLITIVAIFDK